MANAITSLSLPLDQTITIDHTQRMKLAAYCCCINFTDCLFWLCRMSLLRGIEYAIIGQWKNGCLWVQASSLMHKAFQTVMGVCRGTYRAMRYWLTNMFTLRDLREALPLIVVMSISLLITGGSMEAGSWAREHYRIPTDSSGTDWWFIRGHYLQGLAAGLGILATLPFYFLVRKWTKEGSVLVLFMSMIWLGPDAIRSLIIWWRCSHIMEPNLATKPWQTFDSYLEDRWINISFWAVLIGALIFANVIRKYDSSKKKAEGKPELLPATGFTSP